VLPVIPIKILGLQHAAGSRRRMIFLGTMTAVGVVAFWLVIGSLIAFTTSLGAVSELVSLWWFNLGIAVFIAVMGAGMLGAFSVGLPNWIYAIQPKHDKASGSFFFGVMTAVLATPCVAPFGGAAAAWATKQSPLLTLVVFASIGLGMAIPYWLLAANPKWISFIPRAGPASEVVKQVLGMLLLAVAIFFAGTGLISLVFEFPHLALVLHWWAVCIAIASAALWLITRTFSITKSPARRGVFTLLSLTLAIASVWWANYQTDLQRASYAARGGDKTGSDTNTGLWKDYSPEALAAAVGSGKTVVLNFTAEWCLTCKVLESAVLNTDAVQAALRGPNVVAMEADLTSRKAIGWAKLRELKEAGIPLLVVWRPGTAGPWISNAYTVDQVISNVTGK